MAGFKWTQRATNAALLLAEGMSRAEVIREAAIPERTLYNWLSNPEFADEVDRLTLMTGIAARAGRVRIARRAIAQRIDADGVVLTKADILDWLKFVQSETDGSKSDIADKLAAILADRLPASFQDGEITDLRSAD